MSRGDRLTRRRQTDTRETYELLSIIDISGCQVASTAKFGAASPFAVRTNAVVSSSISNPWHELSSKTSIVLYSRPRWPVVV